MAKLTCSVVDVVQVRELARARRLTLVVPPRGAPRKLTLTSCSVGLTQQREAVNINTGAAILFMFGLQVVSV